MTSIINKKDVLLTRQMGLTDKVLSGIGAVAIGVASANSDMLQLRVNGVSGTASPDPIIDLVYGGNNGLDGFDSSRVNFNTPQVGTYSIVGGTEIDLNQLSYDFNGTVLMRVSGEGLSGVVNPLFSPQIIDTSNCAFTNKNIIGDVYAVTNGVRAGLVRSDNWKAMAAAAQGYNLSVSNGSFCFKWTLL